MFHENNGYLAALNSHYLYAMLIIMTTPKTTPLREDDESKRYIAERKN